VQLKLFSDRHHDLSYAIQPFLTVLEDVRIRATVGPQRSLPLPIKF